MPIQVETARTRAGLQILSAGFVQAVGLAMRVAIQATASNAKTTTLFRDGSGQTRSTIRGELQSFDRGFVKAGGAAGFLESGTQAHVIRGNPMLRFVVNGQTLFRRMVRHPGTAARPFMHQARDAGAQVLRYAIDEFVSAAIRRAK